MLRTIKMTKTDSFVPAIITQQAIDTASKFAREQHTKEKAKQVYLNTLAVYIVKNYLRMMGIATNLNGGDSWNPAVRFAADIADLEICDVGRLECRALVNQQEKCYIPPEAIDDRIGYVLVDINLDKNEAYLLGFVEKVQTEELSVNQLLPMADLWQHISQIKQKSTIVKLSQWLNDTFESAWETLENIFTPSFHELAFSFRSNHQIIRGKRLDLKQGEHQVALCVALSPLVNEEMDISINLYPIEQQVLPSGLQLILLDEQGTIEMQAEARNNDGILAFQFTGELEESFSLKISWGDFSITQKFTV